MELVKSVVGLKAKVDNFTRLNDNIEKKINTLESQKVGNTANYRNITEEVCSLGK